MRGETLLTGGARDGLEVTPDVLRLPLGIVNVYLFGEPNAGDGRWVLVDTGIAGWTGRIVEAAAERFGAESRPSAIILTHGHFDHVGGVRQLIEKWDVPIYAHELELPYLTGRSSYPPPDPTVGGGLMSLLSFAYSRGPIDLGDRVQPLPVDGSVPGMPDFRWTATPGHSPGHVSLFREGDGTLIVGDAFVTTRQESALAALLKFPAVSRPPAYFTPDWTKARRSVEKLALLRAHVAATGHGIPMYGERMQTELDRLVREWERLALPANGRYVREPARANKEGVTYVPPLTARAKIWRGALIGGALLAGAILLHRARRK